MHVKSSQVKFITTLWSRDQIAINKTHRKQNYYRPTIQCKDRKYKHRNITKKTCHDVKL